MFDKQEIELFNKFKEVRDSGRCNMLDSKCIGITKEQMTFVIENWDELEIQASK